MGVTRRETLGGFGAAFLLSGGAAAASPEPPTLRQSLEIHQASRPRISPDGARILYELTRTDWGRDAFESDLWLADRLTGERRRLTAPFKSSMTGEWSPDSRRIAFLSDRPGTLDGSPADQRQVWVMSADGGEARQLTALPRGVRSLAWLPEGRRIAVVASDPDPREDKARQETYGVYGVVHGDYAMDRIFLVDVPGDDDVAPVAKPQGQTPAAGPSVGSLAVSPDGRKIAFSATKDPDLISGGTSAIYVLDLESRGIRRISGDRGPDANPVWSPDGGHVAFETSDGAPNYFFANRRVAVVAADGGERRVLTADFDEDAELIGWGAEGVLFGARQRTEAGLFRVDPKSGVTTPTPIAGVSEARSANLAASGALAFLGAGANRFPEVMASGADGRAPRVLTAGGDQFRAFAPARREVVGWTSKDGTPIEGVLYSPPGGGGRRLPLFLVIHGGPVGQDTPALGADRYYPIERLVARGALVLRPNYRGSAGYGARFRALNVRNLGLGDFEDVISGVDAMIARGLADPDRLGAMGWSEGGYISAFITTYSDRFRAVSVGAGISDWRTYYANTDITPFTRQYLGATPWDDEAIYLKTSPIAYISRAKTPTLIQHGGVDRRVPIANAYELRQALEDRGVPVRMVVYDGFGHPINKPRQQRAVMAENEAWFGHYVFGDPPPPPLAPDPLPQPKPAA